VMPAAPTVFGDAAVWLVAAPAVPGDAVVWLVRRRRCSVTPRCGS
jgi:hypothetical protein